MDKRFLAVLATIVLLFTGYIFIVKQKGSSNTTSATVSSHKLGAGNKKVTLTEYGDFQCYYCGLRYPTVSQVLTKYGDDITFEFKNFPIDSAHPNARAAHRAAEAASQQNKFFEMYDLLYKNQASWSSSNGVAKIFEGYATNLGLNLDTYRTAYSSEAVNDTINADAIDGKKLGVTGTPTFFLNGRLLKDTETTTYDGFVQAIDAEIAKVTATP